METTAKIYSGITLLDKVFQFIEMTPNSAEWNIKSLKANPPRQIRLQQIESLLKAFCDTSNSQSWLAKTKAIFLDDKKTTIKSFLKGDFIQNRTIEEYSEVTRFIKDFVKAEDESLSRERAISLGELIFIFPKLVDFKKRIRSVLTFNSGWLEASSEVALFSIYLTNSVAGNLAGKYEQLDNVLELCINPKRLAYTETELIEKFDFPSRSLEEVDIDFM